MPDDPLLTRTRTADVGAAQPAGTQPFLVRIFACDRPGAPAARYPLGAVSQVTIGRGTGGASVVKDGPGRRLDVRCPDSWMSSAHVRLDRALSRWHLEDQGSKNGTLVQGLPVRRTTLDDGDVIEIGQTFFLFRAALADPGGAPAERDRPLSPGMEEREDFGLAVARALTRLAQDRVRLLPSAARLLVAAWPIDLDRCLRAALKAAAGAPIAPAHLPSPLPPPPAVDGPQLRLEGEFWTVVFGPDTVRLKDSDGLRYLAHLIERPDTEVHVSDLLALGRRGRAAPAGGAGPAEAGDVGDLGDAGPLLDAGARTAYKRRLEVLRDAAEEAREFGDRERAARAEEEMEFLAAELARAVGLGGRDRKASSAAERIRVNVTMRIRSAMKRLAESCPPLGRHLERSVSTGIFCRYSDAR